VTGDGDDLSRRPRPRRAPRRSPPPRESTEYTTDELLIGRVEEEVTERVEARVQAELRQYRGPLPSPEMLKAYGDALPNGPERIVHAWEREIRHRQEVDTRLSRTFMISTILGQVFAFLVIAIFAVGAIYLLSEGHEVVGLISLLPPLGAVAWYFLVDRAARDIGVASGRPPRPPDPPR
jgi:uncharacterized membrane protein